MEIIEMERVYFLSMKDFLETVGFYYNALFLIVEIPKNSIVFEKNWYGKVEYITDTYIIKKIVNINEFYFDDYANDKNFLYSLIDPDTSYINFLGNKKKNYTNI
jgi:hypothetical protein